MPFVLQLDFSFPLSGLRINCPSHNLHAFHITLVVQQRHQRSNLRKGKPYRTEASTRAASMQRSKTTSSHSSSSASTALRRTLRSQPDHSDDDDIADPRPWETRASLKLYGSTKEPHSYSSVLNGESALGGDLPLYGASDDMETRRRHGEKEAMAGPGEKELLDDQGKWMKGHGAGPGIGGRRGLPPRQRTEGWVSYFRANRFS